MTTASDNYQAHVSLTERMGVERVGVEGVKILSLAFQPQAYKKKIFKCFWM